MPAPRIILTEKATHTLMRPTHIAAMAALTAALTTLMAAAGATPGAAVHGADTAAWADRGRLRVVEWNVENLFDTLHDAGKRDEEFLPTAARRWTSGRYWRKLTDIARVIATLCADGRGMVDMVGLCEVENDSVMHTLTRRSPLRKLGYEYVMTRSDDERGIDVALMYNPFRFRLLSHESVRVASRDHGLRPTRDLLYARGLVFTRAGLDTLHVIVAHLPSRAGGPAGDRNRRLAAARLWELVDSIQGRRPRADAGRGASMAADTVRLAAPKRIIVMGDFNAGADDAVFAGAPLRLTDDAGARGTYCYRGFWQWLDHVLVSDGVEPSGAAMVVRLPWLVEENRSYGGDMPRRTFRGPTYHGGVSDHLPLAIEVWLR